MTFVLLMFPAAIAIALHVRQHSWKRALQVAGAGVGVVAAVLLFGAVRLSLPQKQIVKVGLITSDEKLNDTVTDPGVDTERLFRDYAREAERLATDGAQAILMPEKLGVTLEGKAGGTDAVMQSVSAEKLATIVAGVVHVAAPVKYNEARIYVPGSVVQRYDKEHMLPLFESNLKPGTTLTVLPRPQQKWLQIDLLPGGGNSQMVGNPSFITLWKACPSSGHNAERRGYRDHLRPRTGNR
jgi:apolipoprotein N-acyltransferase